MEEDKAVAVSFVTDENTNSWNVYLENNRQPLAGRKDVHSDTLFFRPLIPFQPGLTYDIRINGGVSHTFTVPEYTHSKPEVIHIYPSPDTLPSNLLKFYIRFSEPMSEGDPYPFIHLVSNQNDTLDNAFLMQLPVLWNEDQTMLTLWLDPGRIKRDLELNRRLGTPLEPGTSYNLVIEDGLQSRNGESLRSGTRKSFTTTTADRTKPVPDAWSIQPPEPNSTQPLVIRFHEVIDYQSTQGRFEILIDNEPVEGQSGFSSNEKIWRFVPNEPWRRGNYIIKADSRMEDLAGNNLNRLFDRDIQNEESLDKPFHTIRFTLK